MEDFNALKFLRYNRYKLYDLYDCCLLHGVPYDEFGECSLCKEDEEETYRRGDD